MPEKILSIDKGCFQGGMLVYHYHGILTELFGNTLEFGTIVRVHLVHALTCTIRYTKQRMKATVVCKASLAVNMDRKFTFLFLVLLGG